MTLRRALLLIVGVPAAAMLAALAGVAVLYALADAFVTGPP